MHDTNKRTEKNGNVMRYIRWKVRTLTQGIDDWNFYAHYGCSLFLCLPPIHRTFLSISCWDLSARLWRPHQRIFVWQEDYFLTKLKTYLHTNCHVPSWCFNNGMFNKLSIITSLVPSFIAYDFFSLPSLHWSLVLVLVFFFTVTHYSCPSNLSTKLGALEMLIHFSSSVIFYSLMGLTSRVIVVRIEGCRKKTV